MIQIPFLSHRITIVWVGIIFDEQHIFYSAEARKAMEESAAAQRRVQLEARAKRTALRAYMPSLPPREANILVKLTIGVLTAAFSAVAFTALHTARDWPWWFS